MFGSGNFGQDLGYYYAAHGAASGDDAERTLGLQMMAAAYRPPSPMFTRRDAVAEERKEERPSAAAADNSYSWYYAQQEDYDRSHEEQLRRSQVASNEKLSNNIRSISVGGNDFSPGLVDSKCFNQFPRLVKVNGVDLQERIQQKLLARLAQIKPTLHDFIDMDKRISVHAFGRSFFRSVSLSLDQYIRDLVTTCADKAEKIIYALEHRKGLFEALSNHRHVDMGITTGAKIYKQLMLEQDDKHPNIIASAYAAKV